MTSHFDATLALNKNHVNALGQPILMDRDTDSDWWNQRESIDACPIVGGGRVHVLIAGLDALAPARWVHEDESFSGSLREPDFYDEGKAFWLTPDAVVSIDESRIDQIESILALEPRLKWREDRLGWTRIHPNQYGVEVDGLTGDPHCAHSAWDHLATAIKKDY